jgi:hypothetical protein
LISSLLIERGTDCRQGEKERERERERERATHSVHNTREVHVHTETRRYISWSEGASSMECGGFVAVVAMEKLTMVSRFESVFLRCHALQQMQEKK